MQAQPIPEEWTVAHWMSRELMTVTPDTSVRVAYFKMRFEEIRHLLVVDDDGALLGILSDRDLRGPDPSETLSEEQELYELSNWIQVHEVMTRQAICVQPEDEIKTALKQMLLGQFDSLPVKDSSGALVGILTSHDLLIAFSRLWDELTPATHWGTYTS